MLERAGLQRIDRQRDELLLLCKLLEIEMGFCSGGRRNSTDMHDSLDANFGAPAMEPTPPTHKPVLALLPD